MGAALLERCLARHGIDAAVVSAGTHAWDIGATDETILVMQEHGLDVGGHRSRQVTGAMIDRADLVLGMTRDHVRAILLHRPDAKDRTFVVGELARLGRTVGARELHEPVRQWAARAAASRPHTHVVGRAADEVADPIGAPIEVYRETAAALDHAMAAIGAMLAGDPPTL